LCVLDEVFLHIWSNLTNVRTSSDFLVDILNVSNRLKSFVGSLMDRSICSYVKNPSYDSWFNDHGMRSEFISS
jgi:hypothetical protein